MKSKVISINEMGMDLHRWNYESCVATFGFGDDWATLCSIHSTDKNKGHATQLLKDAIEYYKGKKIGGTVALSEPMSHLYKKLNIEEYSDF